VSVWRIATDTPHYTADDLSGQGAERSGGRWNERGTPMVYASSSCALACLETVVHLAGGLPLPLNRYLVRIDIPPALWAARTVFDAAQMVGWDAIPAGRVSLAWGRAWAHAGASVLAQVPSAIVPEESNLLINPCTHRPPRCGRASCGAGSTIRACGAKAENPSGMPEACCK
jgi:Uncharacterized conserved protein